MDLRLGEGCRSPTLKVRVCLTAMCLPMSTWLYSFRFFELAIMRVCLVRVMLVLMSQANQYLAGLHA